MILKPKEMAELLGVSVKTLQRWDNAGKLKAFRMPNGRRYYIYEQYLQLLGGVKMENPLLLGIEDGKKISNKIDKTDEQKKIKLKTFVTKILSTKRRPYLAADNILRMCLAFNTNSPEHMSDALAMSLNNENAFATYVTGLCTGLLSEENQNS